MSKAKNVLAALMIADAMMATQRPERRKRKREAATRRIALTKPQKRQRTRNKIAKQSRKKNRK